MISRAALLRSLAVAAVIAGMVLAATGGVQMLQEHAQSTRLAAILAGRDPASAPGTAPMLLQARARYLIGRDNLDDAQTITDRLTATPAIRAALLYELGNARLRRAMELFGQVPFRVVRPFLGLAKSDYRQALAIDPSNWDARYNDALASALLPDREVYQRSAGARMSHDRAVWPDIPGVPNGMP